jgi:hypothetical protein
MNRPSLWELECFVAVAVELPMVAAENGIGMSTETTPRLIDRGVVFRPLNTRRAVLQHTLVWQADKNSEALLAFRKILRHQAWLATTRQ